jgi:hypothetical protein
LASAGGPGDRKAADPDPADGLDSAGHFRAAPNRPIGPGPTQHGLGPTETNQQPATAGARVEVGLLGWRGWRGGPGRLRLGRDGELTEPAVGDVVVATECGQSATDAIHRGLLSVDSDALPSSASWRASLRRARQMLE